jgi:SAM-dependent methyltransferase
MVQSESKLGRLFRVLYELLCGRPPAERPWHFQWLSVFYLHRRLRRTLPLLGGHVLDVGCGAKPYRGWFGAVESYVGLDVASGPEVDVLVRPDGTWPLDSARFDVVLCTQVLEHVENLELTLNEIVRVLKPGGVAVVTFPFLYNEHGEPYDFRRMTVHYAKRLFPRFQIEALERQGGIGSTLVILWLNWFDGMLNRTFTTRLLKAFMLPLWLPLCFVSNSLGLLFDNLDRSGRFYNNVFLMVRKQ